MPESLGQPDQPGTGLLPAGTMIGGRYRVQRFLGEGEHKRSYLAQDTHLGRKVALGLMKTGESAAAVPEWQALVQVGGHDNIVTLYDRDRWGRTDYLVFEYLPRGTLRDCLAKRAERGEPFPADEVKLLGRQLVRALAHIHARGIVHRGISPAKIWLDERGMAHLGDFDTAVRRGTPQDDAITADEYTAPELRAGGAADERSDLYAMGAVLYEVLTLRRPGPAGETSVSRSLAELRPEVPLRLRLLVSRLLEEARERRPQSAEDVLHELRRTPDEVLEELRRIRESADGGSRSASEKFILGSNEAWISTLPFPLASILWLYIAEPDQAGKADLALKFFEALGEFAVTVLLSAGIADQEFFDTHKARWFDGMDGRAPVKLNRATMGAWTELCGRLAATGREMLSGDSKQVDRYLALFGASDTELIEALTAETLHKILSLDPPVKSPSMPAFK
jgi:serine/threonine protein kinase